MKYNYGLLSTADLRRELSVLRDESNLRGGSRELNARIFEVKCALYHRGEVK
jgi:hypothetical protein